MQRFHPPKRTKIVTDETQTAEKQNEDVPSGFGYGSYRFGKFE